MNGLKAISEVRKGLGDLLSNVRPSLRKPSGLVLARCIWNFEFCFSSHLCQLWLILD